MTVVLDAYAVLAMLKGEPAAERVEAIVGGETCALSAVGVTEVIDHLVRIVGVSEDEAALDLAQLGLDEGLPITGQIARDAGFMRARHYHRVRRAVSLADCVLAETARAMGWSAATSDPHLLDTCHAEHIGVIVLPGTTSTWEPPNSG